MPLGDPCQSLSSYINFALWTNGSAFTVGEVEDSSSLVQPHPSDVVQPNPEHSPSTPLTTGTTTADLPADGELPPAASTESVIKMPTKAPELKPQCESYQGFEPTKAVSEGILVERHFGGLANKLGHCNTASHPTPPDVCTFSS